VTFGHKGLRKIAVHSLQGVQAWGLKEVRLWLCRHKFFNTNNLWLNLEELKSTLASSGGFLPLPLIKNKKVRTSMSYKLFCLHSLHPCLKLADFLINVWICPQHGGPGDEEH